MFSWNTSLAHGDYSHEELLALERNERALAQQVQDMEEKHKLDIRILKEELKEHKDAVTNKATLKQKKIEKQLFGLEKARRDDLKDYQNHLKLLESDRDTLNEDLKCVKESLWAMTEKYNTAQDKRKEMEQLFAKSKEDWEKQMNSLKESYMAATKKYDLEKSQWQAEKTKMDNQLSGVIMVAQMNAHHTVSAAISNEAHRQRKRRREEITNTVD